LVSILLTELKTLRISTSGIWQFANKDKIEVFLILGVDGLEDN
jgi:hypothetical protein